MSPFAPPAFGRTRIVVLSLAALTVAVTATPTRAPSPSPEAPRVYTLLDHFERGRDAVDRWLREVESSGAYPGLSATVARCKAACVQLSVRYRLDGSNVESAVASGVAIDGGRRIVTAGHTFDGPGAIDVVARYAGGASREARIVSRHYERFGSPDDDRAVLSVSDPPPTAAATVARSAPREGDLVIVVGYPDGIGVDAAGTLRYADDGAGRPLEPLVALAVVARVSPMTLAPFAGSVPTRGMSGGPVFDAAGNLLGVFVSVSTVLSESGTTHAYDVCALDGGAKRSLARSRIDDSGEEGAGAR